LARANGADLLVLGVNLEDPAEDIKRFTDRFEIEVPIARDADVSAAGALNVMGVPHLVVLRDGKVMLSTPGPVEQLETELPELVEPWLRTDKDPVSDSASPDAE